MNLPKRLLQTIKHFLVCLIFCLSFFQVTAQKVNTDSLWHIAETSNNDSIRWQTLQTISLHYINIDIDSNFYYSKRIISLCKKINTPRYNAFGILQSCYANYRIGDYKTVQEHITEAAAIAEKYNDLDIQSRVENYRYLIENDPVKRIEYIRKAVQLRTMLQLNDRITATLIGNFSGSLLSINQVDSAFYYAQKMYDLSIKTKDTTSSYVMAVMGNVYLKMNQPDIAYAFYKKGIKCAIVTEKYQDLIRAYLPMARYFSTINQQDSALYYWKKPFELGPKLSLPTKIYVSEKIYDYYLKAGNKDSTIKYMQYYIQSNDSINSINKVAQLEAAKFEYDLKQQDIEKAKIEDKESRNHNIQLAITAIAILSAIILFLLLSRSILVSHKVVEFLSVLVLLVVFEFINLLIHPFLESITHHSPVLMLLGLVAIASLIIPLHHRLEHWTTKILVEKNKTIRLANARKTIEELGEENQGGSF